MSTDESQYEPDLVIVDEASRLRSPVKKVNEPVYGPTRRERRAVRAARRAWKLKRRRATWGGNAWRVAS